MNKAIETIAAREGKTPEEIREAMQEALDAAWTSNDLGHMRAQKNLTGNLRTPNLEEFFAAILKEARNRLDRINES